MPLKYTLIFVSAAAFSIQYQCKIKVWGNLISVSQKLKVAKEVLKVLWRRDVIL